LDNKRIIVALDFSAAAEALGAGFVTVTPGIRLPGNAKGGQARVVTPAQAMQQGAHYLVIGRPVTRSADPAATLAEITRSIGREKAIP
jgi:orotidine-5'-phosphate decarboxylase